MGNFEKMVVLAVLFLSAIVLAVSLNDDGSEVEATGPLAAAAERVGQNLTAESTAAESNAGSTSVPAARSPEAPAGEGPGYLLFGELAGEQPSSSVPGRSFSDQALPETLSAARPRDTAGPQARILESVRGLSPSALDDYMVYEVADGDTWNGLALRFYGDGRYSSNLRMSNEEIELRPGARILVPVYDFAQEARADRQPRAPEVASEISSTPAAAKGTGPAPAVGEIYVVKGGDSLSGIAVKAYGNGKLWRPIYDANRDKMRSPDWLQVGMRLVIPDPEQTATAPASVDPDRPRVR